MELYFINNGINYFDGFFFFGFLMFDDSLNEWICLLYIVYVCKVLYSKKEKECLIECIFSKLSKRF